MSEMYFHGQNPKESHSGHQSLIVDVMRELSNLDSDHQCIVDIEVTIKFVDLAEDERPRVGEIMTDPEGNEYFVETEKAEEAIQKFVETRETEKAAVDDNVVSAFRTAIDRFMDARLDRKIYDEEGSEFMGMFWLIVNSFVPLLDEYFEFPASFKHGKSVVSAANLNTVCEQLGLPYRVIYHNNNRCDPTSDIKERNWRRCWTVVTVEEDK